MLAGTGVEVVRPPPSGTGSRGSIDVRPQRQHGRKPSFPSPPPPAKILAARGGRHRSESSGDQREQRAENREQGNREQRTENREQRAESREQRVGGRRGARASCELLLPRRVRDGGIDVTSQVWEGDACHHPRLENRERTTESREQRAESPVGGGAPESFNLARDEVGTGSLPACERQPSLAYTCWHVSVGSVGRITNIIHTNIITYT